MNLHPTAQRLRKSAVALAATACMAILPQGAMAASKANLNFAAETQVLTPYCLAFIDGSSGLDVSLSEVGYKQRRKTRTKARHRKSAPGLGADDADITFQIRNGERQCVLRYEALREGEALGVMQRVVETLTAAGYTDTTPGFTERGKSVFTKDGTRIDMSAGLTGYSLGVTLKISGGN